mmetsp:Transcript_61372/g.97287  ORF Transcript_61372/g.97287 Transcript_61372/m.97287 type:complete len:276 (+) Transcript_61372:930-1757(+)
MWPRRCNMSGGAILQPLQGESAAVAIQSGAPGGATHEVQQGSTRVGPQGEHLGVVEQSPIRGLLLWPRTTGGHPRYSRLQRWSVHLGRGAPGLCRLGCHGPLRCGRLLAGAGRRRCCCSGLRKLWWCGGLHDVSAKRSEDPRRGRGAERRRLVAAAAGRGGGGGALGTSTAGVAQELCGCSHLCRRHWHAWASTLGGCFLETHADHCLRAPGAAAPLCDCQGDLAPAATEVGRLGVDVLPGGGAGRQDLISTLHATSDRHAFLASGPRSRLWCLR